MRIGRLAQVFGSSILALSVFFADQADAAGTIEVDAATEGKPVSPFLFGACLEDVNHEVYGGLYSQMIYGESFAEPAVDRGVAGFDAVDGDWRAQHDVALVNGGPGHKLVSRADALADGTTVVQVIIDGQTGGSAGLILRVNGAGVGADNFDGYEVSIDASHDKVSLGRHAHNFTPLAEAPYDVVSGRWYTLSATLKGGEIAVSLDGKEVLRHRDAAPLPAGRVGLRSWRQASRFRSLSVDRGKGPEPLAFRAEASERPEISGMWRGVADHDAKLAAQLVTTSPFVGLQSQRLTHQGGDGRVGIENRGLNRQGMAFAAGRAYEGQLFARSTQPTRLSLALEGPDGKSVGSVEVAVPPGTWQEIPFAIEAARQTVGGRFSIYLDRPGSVDLGYVLLQPAAWGRFKDLPVRRDVAEGLIAQGVRVLRYGGCMANGGEYRWKKMIGPRAQRPPYAGWWFPHSSNGWGILDFLDLCEKAGFLAIPDFNIDETPQDMADFIEYVNGPADSTWGKRRAADGHPEPYGLTHLQLGNEERLNDEYFGKFEKLARAIWAKDPKIIPVVGDFQYDMPIADPSNVQKAASHITSLDCHRKILRLAKENDREVWFDVHMWTDGPNPSPSSGAVPSYVTALDRLAEGAKHRVAVFEFNANNHEQRRAVANAEQIVNLINDGRVLVGLSANCLQVDKQNDNSWDQGLLFMNPEKVWLQPPGYVTQMFGDGSLPKAIPAKLEGLPESVRVAALKSEDGKHLALFLVNRGDAAASVRLAVAGLKPGKVAFTELAAGPKAANTAEAPEQVKPKVGAAMPFDASHAYELQPLSVNVLRLE